MPVTTVKKTLYDALINGDWVSSVNGMNKYAWFDSEHGVYCSLHEDVPLGFQGNGLAYAYVSGSLAGEFFIPTGGGFFPDGDSIFSRTPYHTACICNTISSFGNSIENFRDAFVSTILPYAQDNVFWCYVEFMDCMLDYETPAPFPDFYMASLLIPKVSTAERPIMRYNGGV